MCLFLTLVGYFDFSNQNTACFIMMVLFVISEANFSNNLIIIYTYEITVDAGIGFACAGMKLTNSIISLTI
jgi:hypothetical protein